MLYRGAWMGLLEKTRRDACMTRADQQIIGKMHQWTRDPRRFVVEAFGMDGSPGKRISAQQEEGLEAYRRILNAKLNRRDGMALSTEEAKDARKVGMLIHSGHGCGKTSLAAWVMLHFMATRPYSRIPCVAPVGPQLRANLWPEVHLWLRKSEFLQAHVQWQAEKVFWKELQGKEWFAYPRSVNVKASVEEQAETLAGAHADNMLVICDEASGIPDAVFRPLEGGLTGPVNFALLIGNPTQHHGYFFEAMTKHRDDWLVLHWNAEDSELVTQESVDRMARKYGKDSNAYRIRVQGLPPKATPDTLIPWDWVMAAVDRNLLVEVGSPIVLGIDVARELGGDASVILRRQGPLVIDPIATFNGVNTQELAYWVLKEIGETDAACAAIDVIGWGAGVYDTLRDLASIPVLPVNVAESATDPDKFMRLRDELWWTLREEFQAGVLSIPNDDELIGELTSIKYNFSKTAKEKIKIESKQELRDRGLSSPNKADALCLAAYAKRFVGRPVARMHRTRKRAVSAWVG